MRLTLSSAAAPAFTLEELLEGCARRGLSGLELVQGHAHGLGPASDAAAIAAARERADAHGVRIVAYRADAHSVATCGMARLSRLLDAPVIAPREWWAGTAAPAGAPAANTSRGQTPRILDDDLLRRALALYQEEGGRLLLAHGSDPAEIGALSQVLEAAGAGGVAGLAWEAVPSMETPIAAAPVLAAAGAGLCHIRLHGGGPEAAAQAGQGIGELLGLLALSGYPGALALSPSTPRYLTAWGFWLGRRGWGCGSSSEEKAAVSLTSARQESIA